jgi:prolyl-tRNA editing enzyme YbaK/EbsC (Cys-tRNA(Pro) deacylase)
MSIAKVKEYFEQWGMAGRILEFDDSSATVELAAQAVGCAPARIAKTLSFLLGDKAILIVVAGDAKISNSKYKAQFSAKAKMIPPDAVEKLTGHAVGGVCPFGINDGVAVYLDESLKRFESVYPACGSGNSAMEMTIKELETYSKHNAWVDVCQGWQ